MSDDARLLEDELLSLSEVDRERFLEDEALRAEARQLASILELDDHDVYRVLVQLNRRPAERLARGLRHARLRTPIHGDRP